MTPQETARRIVAANNYLTLATADRDGHPWASPVYYTPDGGTDLYWVSRPDSQHSRNIAERAEVGIVIYDSRVPIGAAEALYLTAEAARVSEADLERCAQIFSARHAELAPFTSERLHEPNPLRLYRARIIDASVLLNDGGPDIRQPITVPL
ncbi:MAG TPA: pyridoxamine 5'-phosphate oxidase family protein [Pseudonocardiaceae bacterium]|jgi:nitroimidazol reductase NimA-like FMN-containing flavoprotein (pyridoxamine 5'-phosphate oxidase superfamily)